MKSILKSEQPSVYSKNYNGGGSRSTIPDVTSFFLDKEDGTLVWTGFLRQIKLFLYKNILSLADQSVIIQNRVGVKISEELTPAGITNF